MLPKTKRLKKEKDFNRVFRRGKKFNAGCLSFLVIENGLKTSRFGFVVAKTVSKKAVVRNKVRRRLQESAQKQIPAIKQNIDGVFIARPGCDKYKFGDIEIIIQGLFQKANIL